MEKTTKQKQMERLAKIYMELQLVVRDWDNDDIINYPQELPSLDELTVAIGAIDLKTK